MIEGIAEVASYNDLSRVCLSEQISVEAESDIYWSKLNMLPSQLLRATGNVYI